MDKEEKFVYQQELGKLGIKQNTVLFFFPEDQIRQKHKMQELKKNGDLTVSQQMVISHFWIRDYLNIHI